MALTVVYASATGHVVGALARTGPAAASAAPPDPAALVGRALPLRVALGAGRTAVLPLHAGELASAFVDEQPAVFADPLAFGVDLSADGRPKPVLPRLAAWTGGGLALAPDGLTVTVPLAPVRAARIVALVSGGQDTHVLAGEIPPGRDRVTLPLALAEDGTHGVLVLVTGWAGRLEKARVA
ncbi:hypothetical protein AB0A99_19250 [Streptomyces fradiae]|uniref:hypothetical protein n=1 Tax=Streptomyces fradiae TaxID=1906 RepID=UPI0033F0ABC4